MALGLARGAKPAGPGLRIAKAVDCGVGAGFRAYQKLSKISVSIRFPQTQLRSESTRTESPSTCELSKSRGWPFQRVLFLNRSREHRKHDGLRGRVGSSGRRRERCGVDGPLLGFRPWIALQKDCLVSPELAFAPMRDDF